MIPQKRLAGDHDLVRLFQVLESYKTLTDSLLAPGIFYRPDLQFETAVRAYERYLLESAVEAHGSIPKAAKALGLSRSAAYRVQRRKGRPKTRPLTRVSVLEFRPL